MHETPAVVVIGGSNSLLRDGWVDQLKAMHPRPDQVINLSIGAATTAMGLYRLLSCVDLPPDPVILWEYSLNETNYFLHRQPGRGMMYHNRWLLEICRRRGYRVLPVLLYNKSEATGEEQSRYRGALANLLARYGLHSVDAQQLWLRDFSRLSADVLYRDNPHYSTETGFPRALARAVLERASQAVIPRDSAEDGRFTERELRILAPDQARSVNFVNRIIDCNIHPMAEPLHIQMDGRLLACFMIASKRGPAIIFQSGSERRGPYSAQISARESGPEFQLKHLLLWAPGNKPMVVQGHLTITPRDPALRKPIVQHTLAWNGACPPETGADAAARGGMIGVLAEVAG